MTRVLVIAAHPDDEVLGCGGTIARAAAEGHEVTVAILGEGITSRFDQREAADRQLLVSLQSDSARAAATLGAARHLTFSLPDNRFDTVPLLDVVKIVEGLIAEVRPDEVYTQHGGDLNIDHVITYRATLIATRPLQGHSVRAVYSYEVASSTEWAFQKFSPAFEPNVFVDIAGSLEQKIAAMQCYESEARAFPHPRSPEALCAQARRWGSVVGLEAAEAFQLVRTIR